MNNKKIKIKSNIISEMEELAENIDKVADWIYQRQEFDHAILVHIFNQLLSCMQKMADASDGSDAFKIYLEMYRQAFSNMTAAYENKDLILTADILHHEFVKELLSWNR